MNVVINKLILERFHINKILFPVIIITAIITGIIIVSEKWLYAGILLIPLLIYLCIHKPFIFPFGAYVFLLPFDSVLSVTGNSQGATLTKLLGILTILVLLFNGIFEKKMKRLDTAAIGWVLFTMYCLLSITWAIEPGRSLSIVPTIVGLLLLYLVTVSYQIDKSEFITLKWCILLGGFAAAVFSSYTYMIGNMSGTSQRASLAVGGRFTNPNEYAFVLTIPLSICINMMMNQKRIIKRLFFGIVLGVILFGIISTGSRGGSVGAAIVFIVYLMCIRQKITYGTIALVIGCILMVFIPDFFFDRWGEAAETGGAGRLEIWYVAWKSLEKYWAFGAGLRNFSVAYDEFGHFAPTMSSGFDAHNVYVQSLVQYGIFGFALLLFTIKKHYKIIQLLKSTNKLDLACLKGIFWALLFSSFFSNSLTTKAFWLVWMLIIMYNNYITREKISS